MGENGRLERALKRIDSDIRWALKWFGAIVAVLIAFYILLGFDLEASGLPTELGPFSLLPSDNRLRTVGIAASSILTFALIYVYRKIGDIQQHQADQLEGQKDLQKDVNVLQERQTEILEKQEAWLRAEHTPKLFIHSWDVCGDNICVKLSNYGNGVAIEMEIVIRIYPGEQDWTIEPDHIEYRGPLRDTNDIRAKQPDKEKKSYQGIPKLQADTVEDIDEESIREELVGTEEIYCWVMIEFEDIAGEDDEQGIWAAQTEVTESDFNIQNLVANMEEIIEPFEPIVLPNSSSH